MRNRIQKQYRQSFIESEQNQIEQIIFEGKTYNYNKGFFTTIDSIFDNEITLKKYILSNMELNYLLILAESDMSVGISTTFAGQLHVLISCSVQYSSHLRVNPSGSNLRAMSAEFLDLFKSLNFLQPFENIGFSSRSVNDRRIGNPGHHKDAREL